MDGEDGAALDCAQFVAQLHRVLARQIRAYLFHTKSVSARLGVVVTGKFLALLGNFNLIDEPFDLGFGIAVRFEDERNVLIAFFGFDIFERLLDFRLASHFELRVVLLGTKRVGNDARIVTCNTII